MKTAVKSNYNLRKDGRSPEEHQRNLSSGVKIQKEMLDMFIELHEKFVAKNPTCPLKILDVKHIANDKVDRGMYVDHNDADILIEREGREPYWRRVELEAVEKPNKHNAHFKRTGIEKCVKNRVPILHWQLGVFPQKFFIFSVPFVEKIDAVKGYQCIDGIYKGKPVYKFDTLFPHPKVEYVNWPDLGPVDDYKKLLKYLIIE